MITQVKLRWPEGKSDFAIEGHNIRPDADGSVIVRSDHVPTFLSHGFAPWDAPEHDLAASARVVVQAGAPADIDPRRQEIFARLFAMPTDQLEALLEGELGDLGEVEDFEEDTNLPPDPEDGPDFESMSRTQLFEYLKARNVRSSPPITNEKLRELAINAPAEAG
jgi:hypothetical protein